MSKRRGYATTQAAREQACGSGEARPARQRQDNDDPEGRAVVAYQENNP
jgi:hypothetical protein